MINDEYVKFGTAKLLKEKGFDGNTNHYYADGDVGLLRSLSTINWNDVVGYYSAPTQQMAMRWLREERGIHIYPIPANGYYYWASIYIENGNITLNKVLSRNGRKAYEEAVEAALKYCLTNLI